MNGPAKTKTCPITIPVIFNNDYPFVFLQHPIPFDQLTRNCFAGVEMNNEIISVIDKVNTGK